MTAFGKILLFFMFLTIVGMIAFIIVLLYYPKGCTFVALLTVLSELVAVFMVLYAGLFGKYQS